MIQVKDKQFVPYIDSTELNQRITQLADEINAQYGSRVPLFLVVLNGAFIFAAELLQRVSIPCEITFVKLASYQQTASTGKVKQLIGLEASVQDRDVVVVEDIVDTGLTMHQLMGQLTSLGAKTVKVATLLHKPDATRNEVPLDFVGFTIQNKFVVGYGLDYDGLGRNLPAIYVVADG